ncbi:MAG: hypothetical protein M3N13_01650, partial [Candidatus Eremiobacteraeota bacterium]|nr:hypothetical protein [Candidatus Eremiobacteraeota bacterium]
KNAVARAAGAASKAVDLVLALERDRSVAQMHIAEQSVPAVLAARRLPGGISALSGSSGDERHRYDGLDGAYIIQCSGDRRIETWGDEHPVLAIRQGNNGGISLRLEERDETWKAIQSAIAGQERVEITLDGFVRDANEVERRTSLVVVVGRTNAGRILISVHPLAEPDRTMQVRLSRESADYLARAMELTDYRQRKLLVFEALHEDMEITNALAR